MTAPPAQQDALFTPESTAPEPESGAVSYLGADTGAYSAVLAGDGYGWLARVLPPPAALPCPRCRRPMRLAAVPLLWECALCDTRDERRNAS